MSEYGMLLTTARWLMERGGSEAFFQSGASSAALRRLAGLVLQMVTSGGRVCLGRGVPEADQKDIPATYFHNNAWLVRGMEDWAAVLARLGGRADEIAQIRTTATELRRELFHAIELAWPRESSGPDDWWLRPMVENVEIPKSVTGTRLASYTNYRYWPELLSSGVLPRRWMERIVASRLSAGGQFCGVTRFEGHLDDWPLAEHLEGLWALGRRDDFLLCLWGHIFYHQAQGHLTAYEQVTFPPGRKVAEYCLPCQLVAVRAGRKLFQ